MRQALLIVIATAAGLGACAPVPPGPYGYAPAPSYGYTNGAYAPSPYYAEPGYAPYATPGPAIIVGGEGRWDNRDGDRERYERQRVEGGYRGNPNPPNRDYGRAPPPQNFGGNRPGPENRPMPVAAARPAPAAPQARSAPPAGGAAFEQWNRSHVNAAPSLGDSGPH